MKSVLASVSAVLLLTVLAGCGATAKMIQTKSQSERTDVFTEVTDTVAKPQGSVDLIVKANIKIHEAGYFIGESATSLHGKPGYPFLLNIDGQAAVWNVEGEKDVKPVYDDHGRTSADPEAGTGIKYVLKTKLRLRQGLHKIYFGLPADAYSVETEITLRDGEEAILEFKPRYRYMTLPTRIPSFLKGISRYEIYLNGGAVKEGA